VIPDSPEEQPKPLDVSGAFQRAGGYVKRTDVLLHYGGFAIPNEGQWTLHFHEKFEFLFVPHRFKVMEGGRGGMKSWAVARALIVLSLQKKVRILCAREYQTSIADSVHKLLHDQIKSLGLEPWFKVTKGHIYSSNGSEFLFMGLGDLGQKSNRTKIKSFEGVDICWVEEAESIGKDTWEVLIPTIRKAGSEIWITYNLCNEDDATYQKFHVAPPDDCVRVELNWRENHWISKELLAAKDHLFATDPESAEHVWDGKIKQHAHAVIFRHKYVLENFASPDKPRFYHGVDWGFSNDPLVMIRGYVTTESAGIYGGKECMAGEHLWLDAESWGVGVEINEMVAPKPGDTLPGGHKFAFEKVPTYRQWPVKADSARPELISYVKNKGINITAAEKWSGSVEDGIAHLRGFIMIHIHKTNCPHAAEEFGLYRYAEDRVTSEILPDIIDKNNHVPDAVRYMLDGLIKRRGSSAVWAKLGQTGL